MRERENKIWEEVDREQNAKLKFKLILAAFVESDEELIKELREDAKFIIQHPDFNDEQKKRSINIILSAIKAKQDGIERKNYKIAEAIQEGEK